MQQQRPIVIAGPCVAETWEILEAVITPLKGLAEELDFELVFKASFDKANRSSVASYRGPGLELAAEWFRRIDRDFQVPMLTDVHETQQVGPAAEICQWLQIPAFLSRQTDLLSAAIGSGRRVNVKKGQFMAPEATGLIVAKALEASTGSLGSPAPRLMLTERGTTFGYHNYVVDMRSFPLMARDHKGYQAPVLYDVTHSVQCPTTQGAAAGGERWLAPALARAATATGYLGGYFLEVHPNPAQAKSDGSTQLSISQAETLLRQLVPLWRQSCSATSIDPQFDDR